MNQCPFLYPIFILPYLFSQVTYASATVAASRIKTSDGKSTAYVSALVSINKKLRCGSVFYTFDKGSVKGLKLGISAFYTGKRRGGNNNVVGRDGGLNNTADNQTSYNAQVPLSGFSTVDLSAGYSIGHFSLLAKVSNIFNTLNYVVHDRYSINPIPPRMFAATVSYRF